MTIDNLDKLFAFLYNRGRNYTQYSDIQKQCFPEDDSIDVEGMTLKMHKDGYLDSGAIQSHAVLKEYIQQGINKLSFDGRMAFENCVKGLEGRPYRSAKRRQDRTDTFKVVKIVAAVLNSILIVGLASMGLWQTYKSDKKHQEIGTLTRTVDSLKRVISSKGSH
jgi:hypothetical protein